MINESSKLEKEYKELRNTFKLHKIDNLIEDLKKSLTNVKGKISSKSMENLSKLLKSSENSPKMLNENSFNFEKSIESSNRGNFLQSFTNADFEFLDDEKYKKFRETQLNFIEKTDNELLTNNLEFLLNEIKAMEKKTNDNSNKKVKTNQVTLDNKHEINFKENYDLFSFNLKENQQENSQSNLIKNDEEFDRNRLNVKSQNHSSDDLMGKGRILKRDYIKKSVLSREKENMKRIQVITDGNGVKITSPKLKRNYGLNISIRSILNNNSPVKNKRSSSMEIEPIKAKQELDLITEKNEDYLSKELKGNTDSNKINFTKIKENIRKKDISKKSSKQNMTINDKICENNNIVTNIKHTRNISDSSYKKISENTYKKEKVRNNSGFTNKNEYNHNKKVYNCKNSLSKHKALGDFKELSKIEEENKKSEQAFTYKKTKDYNYTHKNKSIERSIQNDHVKFFIFRRLIFPRRRKFQLSRR